MARTISIAIGSQLYEFAVQMIESGRYGSTSEVVRSALRLFQDLEAKNAALRAAIEAGEKSGESDLTLMYIANQVKERHGV